MLLSLFVTRLLLKELGFEDYGIYVLIFGIVSFLSFFNSAMSMSTQRFLSFHHGSGNNNLLKKTVFNSLILHLVFALFLMGFMLLIGKSLFNGVLNIPIERIEAAKKIYQILIATMGASVLSLPLNALIVSNEKFLFESVVSVVEAILKLVACYIIAYTASDKLIFYALIILFITLLSFLVKLLYSFFRFPEIRCFLLKNFDYKYLKELASFAGWNTFGALCGVAKNQGLSIVFNIFLGTVVNAAFGIATQVSSQLMSFSSNMLKAVSPQIIKNEGGGNRESMLSMSLSATKFSFFLITILFIPFAFNIDYIYNLWLVEVPEFSIMFTLLFLVALIANQLTVGLQTAIQSTGNIRLYQIIVGSTLLINLPISYLILYQGLSPLLAIVSLIVIELIACALRLIIAKKIIRLQLRMYYNSVLKKIFIPFISTLVIVLSLSFFIHEGLNRLFLLTFVTIVSYLIFIYFFGLEHKERDVVKQIIWKKKKPTK